MSYVLHRLPAVANIILTKEYLQFAQQVMSSHDKANKQAELDVSPAMGDMLTNMQGCLKQLCGSSAIGDPEAVAQLIAEKVAAMNISSGDGGAQDSLAEAVTLSTPAEMAVPDPCPDSSVKVKRFKANLIQATALYDSSGSISSVHSAWAEWNCGNGTIADRVKQIKADSSLALGRRNTKLHNKNRHLPQLIESMIGLGASEDAAISLTTKIAEHMSLTLTQMREGARLIAGRTAKQDHDSLTAETTVTLGQYRQAVEWAYQQIGKQERPIVSDAEVHLRGHGCNISQVSNKVFWS